MNGLSRLERRWRSRILGSPFTLTNLLSHIEIIGRDHLLRAVDRQKQTGRGLITISNHLSLFDDPLIPQAILGQTDFNVESKIWWSTPCQSNFCPRGNGLKSRFVRYFSDVANMVYFTRPSRKGVVIELPESYSDALYERGGSELMHKVQRVAAVEGKSTEDYLREMITAGDPRKLAALNQAGMIEACARVNTGDWLHFFPEGTRSRTQQPKKPKRGVGKVLYHCAEADVIPICFYGTQDVLPVHGRLPRPFKKVVVSVGRPVPPDHLARLRAKSPTPERFQELTEAAWQQVVALWPDTVARWQELTGKTAMVPPVKTFTVEDRTAAPEPRPEAPAFPVAPAELYQNDPAAPGAPQARTR